MNGIRNGSGSGRSKKPLAARTLLGFSTSDHRGAKINGAVERLHERLQMNTRVFREATPWGELHLSLSSDDPPVVRLILEGTFLMDSESVASETALAREGLRLWAKSGAGRSSHQHRTLIGGLGLGLTLRALLDAMALSRASRGRQEVVVAELFEPLVAWNQGPLAPLNGRALSDPRVDCVMGDLAQLLREIPGSEAPLGRRFDLMLLDTDNGPTWLSRPENAWLYGQEGVAAITDWLRPGGVVVFWATEISEAFAATLETAAVRINGEWGLQQIEAKPRRRQLVPPDVLYWLRCPPGDGPETDSA